MTGSISRRSPSSMRRLIRASRRRSHHWTLVAELRESDRKRPRSTPPAELDPRQRRLDVGRRQAERRRDPLGRGGPVNGRCPRTTSTSAPPRSDQAGARRAGGSTTSGTKRCAGQTSAASERRSAATQSDRIALEARRAARRRRAPRTDRRSRARGPSPRAARRRRAADRAARRHRAPRAATRRPPRRPPPGSSPPIRSTIAAGSPRRTLTARVRRSSSGASSRKA